MDAIMRILEEIGNLIGRQTQERAATIAQAAEAAVAASINNNNGNQGQGDGLDEFGPVRGFDVPFDGVGDWDPSAIPPPDGELTSLDTSLALSRHQHVPSTPESTVAEPEESQAGYDPMDVDLKVIPKEEEEEEDPKDEPEEEPEEDPEMGLEDVPEDEPEYEPEDEPEEEFDEEERVEAPVESGDIDNPIEIEADSESSEEPDYDRVSDLDSGEMELEWTPSSGRRG
ncbi:uncharacterized protein LOC130135473 [Syzygium oleosum]|uniref:uncharacterized protein LOC130135473 n=1 Tax=Syzygium oleosum TaxID=219896 RepID=UPI0024BB800D|nr:uncharacterized protein LOC130135473 [Syzygium oleosum]